MRTLCFHFFLFTGLLCTAQMKYYLTGRPFGFERNNAIKEVGLRWGMDVLYAGSDVADDTQLGMISKANESVQGMMEKEHGVNWLDKFYLQVAEEEVLHKRIRQSIALLDKALLENSFVLVRREKNDYEAFILDASTAKTRCVARYKGKEKRRIKWKKQKDGCVIPYDFPQNGIIK